MSTTHQTASGSATPPRVELDAPLSEVGGPPVPSASDSNVRPPEEHAHGEGAQPRVVGLDLSLTGTGVASSVGWCETVRSKGTRADTYEQRGARIRHLRQRIITYVGVRPDLVVVEGPSYGSVGSGTWDRAGLWWEVVNTLQVHDIPVAVVSPDQRACYATGVYKSSKQQVMAAAIRRYIDVAIDNDNEADALVLAAMGTRALGHPIDDVPATHLRAMAKVAWPEQVTR